MTLGKFALRVALAVSLALSAFSAAATIITYNFTGTLTSSFGTLHSGDAFSGSYAVDTTVAATGGSTSSFAVFNDLVSGSLVSGSFTATVGPGVGLPEIQQDNVAGADRYALVARNPIGSSQIGGLNISVFSIRLDDTTGTAVSNALTLLTNPSLANFTGNSFFIFLGQPTDPNFQAVSGTLTSLRVRPTTVPEPATLALLGLGLVGMGFLRRARS